MSLRVGDRISDSTLQYLGDLPDFGHKLVELLRVKRLLAVAESAVGIRMNLDDETVCANGNSSPRQRRNFVALARAVAGDDDDVHGFGHLPTLVDPSHATGERNKVTPLSRAAVAVGADGLIIAVHPDPDRALSDGKQSLYPEQFDELMAEVREIAKVLKRTIADPVANPEARRAIPAGSAASR